MHPRSGRASEPEVAFIGRGRHTYALIRKTGDVSFLPRTIRVQRNAGGARAALFRGGAAWALVPGVVVLLVCPDSRAADALWAAHVEPLLKKHCVECHNPDKAKSALDLTSLQSILRGGDRGASVIPGRPDDSNLYKFLSADSDPHMPPGNRKKLSEEEAALDRKSTRLNSSHL